MNKMLLGAAAAALSMIAGAALAQAPAAGAAPPPQAPMVIKAVKPGVYMVVGNGGNSTVRVGPSGVILVDTKNPGAAVYAELMDKIKSVTPLPVQEVIITHHHADHSGNTLFFANRGVPVVGHHGELEALQTYAPAGNPDPRPIAPGITYNDSLTVNAGGATAVLHHYAAGHTGGDTLVYFPDVKIVSGGDEVVATAPNVDFPFGGSATGWLKSLDAVSKLDFDYVIPGHGNDPISKADFMTYKHKWDTLVQRGRDAVKAGAPKDKLLASIKTDDLGWNINTPQWSAPARLDPFYAELSK
jgi:cyclase